MRKMPDFCTPRRVFRHDVDTAVATLGRLGVGLDRVRVVSAGPGWPAGTVLGQEPAPGEPLEPRTRVVLTVAGSGGIDHLPYPVRDGDGTEFRADRLMALLDDPLNKLAQHVRQAGGFLALPPDDPTPARRWIEEIFGLSAAPFPRECWYPLARLLPALHRLAGTEDAVKVAFRQVFGLPVAETRVVAGLVPLDAPERTRLGRAASRLGVDAVAGGGLAEHCVLEVTFGRRDPTTGEDAGVELAEWRRHDTPERRAQRDALYRLVVPAHLHPRVRERWRVGDSRSPARLGDPAREALLGVNARLGAPPERRAA